MKTLAFKSNWLKGVFDDPREIETFAALRISVDSDLLTRVYDNLAGADRETIQVPLYPLAKGIADNWWALLYEPRKSEDGPHFYSRHRLDAYMRGFVFPPIAIWSGGEDSFIIETPPIELPRRLSRVELWDRPFQQPDFVAREETENDLLELIEKVVLRLTDRSVEFSELREVWSRVSASISDDEERLYCIAAGRLGLDPYDDDCPDINSFAEGISDSLFQDVCEAAAIEEMSTTTHWIRETERRLKDLPRIPISEFGPPPSSDLSIRPWNEGYQAAEQLRSNLRLDHSDPKQAIKRLFEGMLDKEHIALSDGPSSVDAVLRRTNGSVQGGILKLHPKQRRFHGCRMLYLGWKSADGQETAATVANTRKQQASRAFAAELVAPRRLLRERAGRYGLTSEDIDNIANEFTCPETVIVHQAQNHSIKLRGVFT
jgi:hypothetical protein